MFNNKKKIFSKIFACFSLISLSTTSIALATKNSQDFTNIISFGDNFVSGDNSYANSLTEQLGFAFQKIIIY
jgi:hypothetical protein